MGAQLDDLHRDVGSGRGLVTQRRADHLEKKHRCNSSSRDGTSSPAGAAPCAKGRARRDDRRGRRPGTCPPGRARSPTSSCSRTSSTRWRTAAPTAPGLPVRRWPAQLLGCRAWAGALPVRRYVFDQGVELGLSSCRRIVGPPHHQSLVGRQPQHPVRLVRFQGGQGRSLPHGVEVPARWRISVESFDTARRAEAYVLVVAQHPDQSPEEVGGRAAIPMAVVTPHAQRSGGSTDRALAGRQGSTAPAGGTGR